MRLERSRIIRRGSTLTDEVATPKDSAPVLSLPLTTPMTPDFLELDGDVLVHKYFVEGDARRRVDAQPPKTLLSDFMRLADASDEQILDFAAEQGLLLICDHTIPSMHNPPDFPDSSMVQGGNGCVPMGWAAVDDRFVGREPLSFWRWLTAEAKGIVGVADRLRAKKKGSAEHWKPIDLSGDLTLDREDDAFPWKMTLSDQRGALSRVLLDWQRWGDVRPSLEWQGGQPKVTIGSDGLFGALAVQLVLRVAGTERMTTCSECDQPYNPPRPPRKGERNFCDVCRADGAPQRHAQRDYYARKKQGIRIRRKQKPRR